MSAADNVTKRELIIEVWEQLDCESVGARELTAIQQSVRDRFGPRAVESPGAIARLLADEGAVLRHPEVIDCDADWRERVSAFSGLPAVLNFDDLEAATLAVGALDERRQEWEAELREPELTNLRESVRAVRRDRLLIARSKVVSEKERLEAGEIAEWLNVWLNTPNLFFDWLELRRSSPDFIERFGQRLQ
jgi:hypothetical protein